MASMAGRVNPPPSMPHRPPPHDVCSGPLVEGLAGADASRAHKEAGIPKPGEVLPSSLSSTRQHHASLSSVSQLGRKQDPDTGEADVS